MGELVDAVIKFYASSGFLSWYTPEVRIRELKSLLSRKTPPAVRLQVLKYLDAHLGDIPQDGPDSGKPVIINAYLGHPPTQDTNKINLGEEPSD